jgi:hypothetical protein
MANELSNLKPSPGSTKARKCVGRGEGSGKGKTAGRVHSTERITLIRPSLFWKEAFMSIWHPIRLVGT